MSDKEFEFPSEPPKKKVPPHLEWMVVYGDGRLVGVVQGISEEAAENAMRQQMLGSGVEHFRATTFADASDADVLRAGLISIITILTNMMGRRNILS